MNYDKHIIRFSDFQFFKKEKKNQIAASGEMFSRQSDVSDYPTDNFDSKCC